jgi:hypothetical protein
MSAPYIYIEREREREREREGGREGERDKFTHYVLSRQT